MKPLTKKELPAFVERFGNFKDAEFRSCEVISPMEIKLLFAVQDKARAFDWITVELEFSGISDAKLVEEKKISFFPMDSGANIIENGNEFAFGTGECYNISNIKSSSCYIVSKSLKYKEGLF